MKVVLDKNIIQSISLFQNLTGSNVVDCIDTDEDIYFVVSQGQYGLAVGKNGSKIKNAERVFKKNIKVFEYSENLKDFIQNLVPDALEIEENGTAIYVKVKQSSRAKVIGKNGKNIKIMNELLKRLFDVEGMKLK